MLYLTAGSGGAGWRSTSLLTVSGIATGQSRPQDPEQGISHVGQPCNLLFLFTDEQAAATMRAYGNGRIQSPALDRLADQSVVFRNA